MNIKTFCRGIAAAMGIFALAASPVEAQAAPIAGIAPVTAAAASKSARASFTSQANSGAGLAAPMAAAAVAAATGTMQSPASAVMLAAMATEAAWLHRSGWPLYALVDRYSAGAPLDEQANCLAVAVYHEARGETLEGQLAVARVVMNRASSGKYPSTWCDVVKQPWQFSFVDPRSGYYPPVNTSSASWGKAQAIARLAMVNVVPSVTQDVLWYHADYVAPSWGRRLSRADKIGTHIFYRG